MARFISFVLLAVIVAATALQTPWLLTISTALFWIYALISPIGFFIVLFRFEELKQVSVGEFIGSTLFSILWLSVLAYAGWAWTFGWALMILFVKLGAALSTNK